MHPPLPTGLLILHGDRLELLAQAVCEWLGRHPMAPLETETLLVQSNGMGEWLKMALAIRHGICAATSVELPARFLWRAYRAVLGPAAVPAASPLDKTALTWRLMALLPALSRQPGFEPLRTFLGESACADATDPARRLQLAQRLADLYDQYQVHRSDWLDEWAQGRDVLRRSGASAPAQGGARAGFGEGAGSDAKPVPAAQRWQPALWRALRDTLAEDALSSARPALHQRFVQALRASGCAAVGGDTHRPFPGLPRRVVLFGTTHVPLQTLEAIAALAGHCQVLMAVPNPCRHHWADTLDGRELLRLQHRRHGLRKGVDLSGVPLEQMHAHGHPLLSAWGRQSRDFVRQLDAFDDAEAARQRFALPRIDLFDETPAQTLLEEVQAAVRDLMPLDEHPRRGADPADRSIVFHIAHSAQREVEILHDQLLHLLAHPPQGRPLAPRDIVVMVPDIDLYAPAVRSVFGQHPPGDARHIPWGLADQKDRGRHPMLLALDWLMRAPQQRFGASEVLDLLDVPAVAARLGLGPQDLPLVARWIEGAGVRWGLDAAHRDSLGLGQAGDHNTWAFGLRRMLLGYATGQWASHAAASAIGTDGSDRMPPEPYADIEPYDEVAGLEAGLAGTLAALLQTLSTWWTDARSPRTPSDWAERLRRLTVALFQPTDTGDRALMAALDAALAQWLQACETGGFDEAVDLVVAREAWLGSVDEPGLKQRFRAGGVTFCTLLPLRAIPFEVVCLLGMNDGDYPRRASRGDFDLMALPGLARPGDRSRRDDDRQLMLDALLSARRVLYLSWTGHSQRDNSEQPPSVLVAQLRDYLRAGWDDASVDSRTTVHPLQAFSRRYFEPGGPPTYAAEWRAAHAGSAEHGRPAVAAAAATGPAAAATGPAAAVQAGPAVSVPVPLIASSVGPAATVQALADFLRNPVKAYFRHRLRVSFDDLDAPVVDDEPFGRQGLERWALIDAVLAGCRRHWGTQGGAARSRASAGSVVMSTSDLRPIQVMGQAPDASSSSTSTSTSTSAPTSASTPSSSPEKTSSETSGPDSSEACEEWGTTLSEHDFSEIDTVLADQLDRLWRAGRLPLAGPGRLTREALHRAISPMLTQWLSLRASHPRYLDRQMLHLRHPEIPTLMLDDLLDDLRTQADGAAPVWIELTASRVAQPAGASQVEPRPDKLVGAWVRCLAAAACGHPADGILIGEGARVDVRCPPRDEATATLLGLMQDWQEGLAGDRPIPAALRTGLAWLAGDKDKARTAYEGAEGGRSAGEVEDPCLARLFPDFDRLSSAEGYAITNLRLYGPYRQWLDTCTSVQFWGIDDESADSDED